MKFGAWCVMITVMIMFCGMLGVNTALVPLLKDVGLYFGDDGDFQKADFQSSYMWSLLFGSVTGLLTTLAITGAVTVGLYLTSKDNAVLILPFLVWIGTLFVGSFWSMIIYVDALNQWWMTSLAVLIFGGLGIGFIFSALDYFLGR